MWRLQKKKKHREECTVEPWTGMLRGCYTWSILGFQTRLKIFTRIGTWHTSTFSQKFHCQHKATLACYDSFNGYSEAMGWIAPSWRKATYSEGISCSPGINRYHANHAETKMENISSSGETYFWGTNLRLCMYFVVIHFSWFFHAANRPFLLLNPMREGHP